MSDPDDQLVFTFGLGEPTDNPVDAEILGGKGASLAMMVRAGFPVPPGFTISSVCSSRVNSRDGSWPPGLLDDVQRAMRKLELATGRTFGCGPRPLFVAVRSGAAVSMPGMMDTILNCGMNPSVIECFPSAGQFWKAYAEHIRMFAASVAGLTLTVTNAANDEERARRFKSMYEERTSRVFPIDPWDSLSQCIAAVFASWNSERAQTYRKRHGIQNVSGTAVNIQAMFPSERSGVMFTANPNDPASHEMIIEASWGLGEAVVSGAVTPDIYVLDADTFVTKRIVPGSRSGTESALNANERRNVAELGRRIEQHFGVPSDVEWGIADGRIALLQTRKIRGLEVLEDAERGRLEEIQRLTELSQREPVVWVVHNLSETLPTPTPLTWDLAQWFMSAQGGYGQLYRLLGQHPVERQPGQGFLELIGGRIYVDPRRAAEFHFGRLPFEYDVDDILRDRGVLERPPTRFNVDRTDPLFLFRVPGWLLSMMFGARRMKAMAKQPDRRFEQVALPRLDRFLDEWGTIDIGQLSTADLIRELHRRREFVLGEFAAESLVPGFFGGLAHEQMRRLLIQLFGPEEGEQLTSQLTTGLERDVTVEQNVSLFDVARESQSRDEFLQRFGHRAVNEMELSQPRWYEDGDFVDRMIGRFRGISTLSPAALHARQVEVRHQTETELPAKLAWAGGSSLRERLEAAMVKAQRLLPYRELGKFHLMRGYAFLRQILVELGRRWELGRDLFFLKLDELPTYESNRTEYGRRIDQRKLRWQSAQKLSLADVIDSRKLGEFGKPRPVAPLGDRPQFLCRPLASGASCGTARVVFEPGQLVDLDQDYILVTPSTDPGWTPLFVRAKGLIVERGGILSHGAIVARDFGIPAVVLEDATRLIPDGARIELDANQGLVTFQAVKAATPLSTFSDTAIRTPVMTESLP